MLNAAEASKKPEQVIWLPSTEDNQVNMSVVRQILDVFAANDITYLPDLYLYKIELYSSHIFIRLYDKQKNPIKLEHTNRKIVIEI